jgi:hypothetical protein
MRPTLRAERRRTKGLAPPSNEKNSIATNLISAFVGAMVAILSTSGSEALRSYFGSKAEQTKLEYSLVQAALAAGTKENAVENLDFFIQLGFLSDPEGRIQHFIANPSEIPSELLQRRWMAIKWEGFLAACWENHGEVNSATGECVLPTGQVDLFTK